MFSVKDDEDYLDTLFSSNQSRQQSGQNFVQGQSRQQSRQNFVQYSQGQPLNRIPSLRSSIGSSVDRNNYADKIRNKVKNVKKRKKSTSALSASVNSFHTNSNKEARRSVDDLYSKGTEEAKDMSRTINDTSRRSPFLGNNYRDNRTCGYDGFHLENDRIGIESDVSSQLRVDVAEFMRCKALRESFINQLKTLFTQIKQDNLPEIIDDITVQEKKSIKKQKQQFLLLILALRKNSKRVIECYQGIVTKFHHRFKFVTQTLAMLRNDIAITFKDPLSILELEPYSSWLVVSPMNNIFFQDPNSDPNHQSSASYNCYPNFYIPNELLLNDEDNGSLYVLNGVILDIVSAVELEDKALQNRNQAKVSFEK